MPRPCRRSARAPGPDQQPGWRLQGCSEAQGGWAVPRDLSTPRPATAHAPTNARRLAANQATERCGDSGGAGLAWSQRGRPRRVAARTPADDAEALPLEQPGLAALPPLAALARPSQAARIALGAGVSMGQQEGGFGERGRASWAARDPSSLAPFQLTGAAAKIHTCKRSTCSSFPFDAHARARTHARVHIHTVLTLTSKCRSGTQPPAARQASSHAGASTHAPAAMPCSSFIVRAGAMPRASTATTTCVVSLRVCKEQGGGGVFFWQGTAPTVCARCAVFRRTPRSRAPSASPERRLHGPARGRSRDALLHSALRLPPAFHPPFPCPNPT